MNTEYIHSVFVIGIGIRYLSSEDGSDGSDSN